MIVKYENNRGEVINLSEPPYYLNVEPLLDYTWSYATKDKRRGSIIAGFSKNIESHSLVLHIMAADDAEKNAAIDAFNNAVEIDIYDGIAGKIWFDDWYTYGYIISAKNSKWQYGNPVVKKEIALVREADSWYRVTTARNFDNEEEKTVDPSDFQIGIRDYEYVLFTERTGYDYAFDYQSDTHSYANVYNNSILGSEFVLTIYGYADSPRITLGDTVIHVNIEVPEGAKLVVDSTARTVIMTLADGTEVNAFSGRDPDYYIFRRVDAGRNAVTWDGAYLWELALIEERSEPRWLMA